MQSDDKIQRTFVFLMIFQIMGLAFVVILLSNNALAQTLHDRTLYEVVKQTPELGKNSPIDVGKIPNAIAIGYDTVADTTTVYVTNRDSHSVSVISEENNTKIGEDIPVGNSPVDIAINEDLDAVYVANRDSHSVSVISEENNTKIGEDIPVGAYPLAIAIGYNTDAVYVANAGSDSVSVIDAAANKVVAGIILHVSPFNSGYIECDRLISPTAQYFYVWSGSECIAKPNKGFEFLNWEENLKNNSTQVLKVSPSASPLDSIADFLGIKSDEPEATLNITKFGSFTANFKELPPPLPAEYWASLFTVVVTALIGSWLTPTIIGWRKAKKQGRKLDYYNQEVRYLYSDGKLDKNDISKLDILKNDIAYAYTRGKINKEQYEELMKDISLRYEEIFKKEIDSLDTLTNNEDKMKLLNKIHSDIEDAYSKEKVTEKHYNLLKEKISDYENSKS